MAPKTPDEQARRRAALAAAYEAVTSGPRVQISATVSVPTALLRRLKESTTA